MISQGLCLDTFRIKVQSVFPDIRLEKTKSTQGLSGFSTNYLCWPPEPSQQHMSVFSLHDNLTDYMGHSMELHDDTSRKLCVWCFMSCEGNTQWSSVQLILMKTCLLSSKLCHLFEVKKWLQHFIKRSKAINSGGI